MNRPALILLSVLAALVSAPAADPEESNLTLAQAKARFEKADRALNEAWAAVKKALPESVFAALKENQRGWAEWRDRVVLSSIRAEMLGDEKHTRNSPEYFTMAAVLSTDHALWLRALVQQKKNPDDTLNGSWSDGWGGVIDIVEKDGQLHFSINVVRGRGANIGDLAGIATWNHTIGWFSDKGRNKNKKDETNLAFILRGPMLEIIEANADDYHGHNAFFDGKYVKVGDLDAKKQAEVLQEAKTDEVAR